jgi:hypothetical protein
VDLFIFDRSLVILLSWRGDDLQNRIDEIRWRLTAQLAGEGISYTDASNAIQAMSQLPVETEQDRHTYLHGFLELCNFLIEHGDESIQDALLPQRDIIQQKLVQLYQPDGAYLLTNEILTRFTEGIRNGGSVDELSQQALTEIEGIDSGPDEEDVFILTTATIRVLAIVNAANWLNAGSSEGAKTNLREQALKRFWQSITEHGVIPSEGRVCAEMIQQLGDEIGIEAMLEGLMIVFGLGLMFCPDCGPGMEPVQQQIAQRMQQLSDNQKQANGELNPTGQSEPDQIVSDLAAALNIEGFSQYRLNEASNRVQQLPTETLEQSQVAVDTLNRVIDTAYPYAPDDYKPSMLVLKEWMTKLISGEGMEEITSPDQLNRDCIAVRDDMQHELESGEDVGAAFTRATFRLNSLVMRAADILDEQTLPPVMKIMLEELPDLMSRFVPEDKRQTWRQAQQTLSSLSHGLDDLGSGDQLASSLVSKTISEQTQRLIGAVDVFETDAPEYLKQAFDLILALSNRLTDANLRDGLAERDNQELERLNEAIKADFRMLQAATTEEQVMRHLKGGLRRSALEFRKFERRRLLMVVDPPFPTASLSWDPNSVFFSGSVSVLSTVDQACILLGMRRTRQSGLADYTHGRWQQLRSAGVAIMDYSEYDAEQSDPPQVPPAGEREKQVLNAAANVAQVAYETGWALTLGVPLIVTVRHGRSVPFDVDIAPILLEGKETDQDLLVHAIQIAFYGVHRRVANSTLERTVKYACRWFPSDQEPDIDALFEELERSHDATRVRLALESLFDRLDQKRPLTIIPAFEGDYPQTDTPRLFHVTAFRSWSKFAEQQIRACCQRHDIEYVIGYERLDADIMRAVWKDICRANWVVVDITNLNPNALLELGIAHALGRPVLILTQNSDPHEHLAAIQRIRIHHYQPAEPTLLARLLDRFVK